MTIASNRCEECLSLWQSLGRDLYEAPLWYNYFFSLQCL